MDYPIIEVQSLGKKYVIGHEAPERYSTLRDVLTNKVKQISDKTKLIFKGGQLISGQTLEDFWALKDINFEIKQGDRVGVIGRNGAGKSTLLKILSRITEPTTGKIKIKGRIASLLEVGTGFHPELTGKENIYLNGAILGMSRAEIKRKFDEIVDFSGIEKFLDTPVKRYSSGMYVRLAFAVAAHLEPEILVVDEVLAVGDAEFQKKCLGKMENISSKEGRTILFVSHNMAAIKQLCNIGLLLDQGKLLENNSVDKVINQYLRKQNQLNELSLTHHGIIIEKLSFLEKESKNDVGGSLFFNENYLLLMKITVPEEITSVALIIKIYNSLGEKITSICTTEEGFSPFLVKKEINLEIDLHKFMLFPNNYSASLLFYSPDYPIYTKEFENILSFEVHQNIINEAMWAYSSAHGTARILNKMNINVI